MKKSFFVLTIIIISFSFPIIHSYANSKKEQSEKCKIIAKENMDIYSDKVMDDLLSSFNFLPNEEDETYIYFTAQELWKSQFLFGESEGYQSLKKLMAGSYSGEKRLYFSLDNPNSGLILYRDPNHQNIKINVKRQDDKWIPVHQEVKPGKKIMIDKLECEDRHFMQKMFDNLYP